MKHRKEILLELTPLLDVILIMMFYILMQNTFAAKQEQDSMRAEAEQMMSSAAAEVESVAAEIDRVLESCADEMNEAAERESILSDELANAHARLDGENVLEEYALIANILVLNTSDGGRKLRVLADEETEIVYSWDNMKYAENALMNCLGELVKQSEGERPLFLIFSYNDGDIYRRDYELVRDCLEAAALTGDHIYIRYSEGGL